MYKFLTKNGTLLAFGIGGLISLVFFIIAITGIPAGFADMPKDQQFATGAFDFGIAISIFLTIAAFAALIIFGILQIVSNPKGAMKGIIALAAILVIFFIAYSMADGTVQERWASDFGITEGLSKYVSGALATTIILTIVAIGVFIFSEFRDFFK